MSRKWIAATAGLAMVFSTCAFAQDEAGSGGAAAQAASAAQPPATYDEATSPNAPTQQADEGPVSEGDTAGTPAAVAWTPTVPELAVAGAVAVGAAICIATCGGNSNTTTTTTTSPK